MPELSDAFGTVLSECRTAAQLTQAELAEECGLDRTYIGMLERGQANPTLKVLFQLSAVLGIEPEELISRTKQELHTPNKPQN